MQILKQSITIKSILLVKIICLFSAIPICYCAVGELSEAPIAVIESGFSDLLDQKHFPEMVMAPEKFTYRNVVINGKTYQVRVVLESNCADAPASMSEEDKNALAAHFGFSLREIIQQFKNNPSLKLNKSPFYANYYGITVARELALKAGGKVRIHVKLGCELKDLSVLEQPVYKFLPKQLSAIQLMAIFQDKLMQKQVSFSDSIKGVSFNGKNYKISISLYPFLESNLTLHEALKQTPTYNVDVDLKDNPKAGDTIAHVYAKAKNPDGHEVANVSIAISPWE
jgi:hypothetical protein